MDSTNLSSERLLEVITKKRKCICLSTSGFLLIFISAFSYIIDPAYIVKHYSLRVTPNSYTYSRLQEKVDTLLMRMYFFNITNSERFIAGLDYKLKLQEVGPFTYRETRYNADMKLDSQSNTLKYTPTTNLTFVPEESIADPKDVMLHVPNIMFLAFASQLSKSSFVVRTSFEMLFIKKQLKSILKMSAYDYMWGYDDPLIALSSSIVPGIVYYNKTGLLSFSTHPRRNLNLTLDTTDENILQIKTANGLGGITRLGYQQKSTYCNSFEDAYEGFMYPMNMSPERKIRIYHNFFCRLLDLDYVENNFLPDGTEVLKYQISEDAYENTTDHECLCTTGRCFRGLSDMSPCFDGLPMSLSHGHFLNAEEKVFDRIEGLTPDENIHGSEFLIHKELGLSMSAHFSVQVNIVMDNTNYCSEARPFSNTIIPYTWIKVEQLPLPEDMSDAMKMIAVQLPKIILAVQIVLILLGLCILMFSWKFMIASCQYDRQYRNFWENYIQDKKNSMEKIDFSNDLTKQI